LDDAVYAVKAAGNTIEFCFAVFLFFNGGWILYFESGGTIRALMMVIHAYCNIWLEAKAGWQTFIKRRTAVAKIDRIPDATLEQLEAHNDVCSICYQEMRSGAKVTRCRHFFHGVCLRKWLYVQDTCPLCHSPLYGGGPSQGDDRVAVGAADENAQRQRDVFEGEAAAEDHPELAVAQVDIDDPELLVGQLPHEVIDSDESPEDSEDSSSSSDGFIEIEAGDEDSTTSDEERASSSSSFSKMRAGNGSDEEENASGARSDDDDDLIYDSMGDFGSPGSDEGSESSADDK